MLHSYRTHSLLQITNLFFLLVSLMWMNKTPLEIDVSDTKHKMGIMKGFFKTVSALISFEYRVILCPIHTKCSGQLD